MTVPAAPGPLRPGAADQDDHRMPIFTAADGTRLAYHLRGSGEPLDGPLSHPPGSTGRSRDVG